LNPLHPRADGEAMAAGSKKRFPISFPISNLRSELGLPEG